MGPLANRVQFMKVLQLIEKAREEGDTIALRRRSAARRRLFCLTDGGEGPERKQHADAGRDLRSGVQFIGYQSEEEALSRINASLLAWPPASGRRISAALRYSDAINAGIVWVNMHTFLDRRCRLAA
jgi:phenylacetaldehyde dehydrogenase